MENVHEILQASIDKQSECAQNVRLMQVLAQWPFLDNAKVRQAFLGTISHMPTCLKIHVYQKTIQGGPAVNHPERPFSFVPGATSLFFFQGDVDVNFLQWVADYHQRRPGLKVMLCAQAANHHAEITEPFQPPSETSSHKK